MSESNIKVTSSASTRNSKRLLFDRRYGWVFAEWKDPAEEALAGGRQMFCIVPVSKAFFRMASQWINLVGSSTVEVIKRPELLSPQILQSKFNDQRQRFPARFKRAAALRQQGRVFAAKDGGSVRSGEVVYGEGGEQRRRGRF
ncbi:hypothetical protein Vadar_003070 [Vaccinium darrowii]|uniref:Uncharacterized protein n=1 Tax=Vaccinium darrowii TaxID=229202 RepID=A0ACB7Z1B8_9ERIC|nr:hypothetical protein Vadar_003070 [Vaccinium darrowii]